MDTSLLYLVRHGQSILNVQKRVQGKSVDSTSSLSDIWRQQVLSRAETLANVHFDICFSSPVLRCIQTTEIMIASRGIPLIKVPELQEKDQGTSVGISRKELYTKYPSWETMTEDQRLDIKTNLGEESQRELRDRAFGILRKIARENTSRSVLIITHGGFMRAVYTYLSHKSLRDIWHFENCGYMELEYINENFTIRKTVGLSLKTVADLV